MNPKRYIPYRALGDLYLVCFVAVFIFVIMSVFISIIQDAYVQAKVGDVTSTDQGSGFRVQGIGSWV